MSVLISYNGYVQLTERSRQSTVEYRESAGTVIALNSAITVGAV